MNNSVIKSIFITFFYYLFLNGTLTLLFTYLDFEIISSNTNVELINLSVITVLGLIILAFYKIKKLHSGETNKINTKNILFIVLIILLVRVFNDPIYRFDLIIKNKGFSQFVDYNKIEYHILILNFIKLIIITPIVEELTFRGIILNNINKEYSFTKSLIISSIMFSIIHINPLAFNITTLIVTVITGAIFGLIFYRYGLIYSIIAHCTYNFIWLALILNGKVYFNFLEKLNFGFLYWLIIIASLILSFFCIKGLCKNN